MLVSNASLMTGMELVSEFTPERVAAHFPVETEEKILTMDRPVIIESACPGWQVGGNRFPAVPISIKDQIRETVDSIRAGAVAVHMHPRDPKTGNAQANPKLLAQILGAVFDEVGDFVTLSHTWAAHQLVDYVVETSELLELGQGNKYCQGSVVLRSGHLSATGTFHPAAKVKEGVQYLEDNDIKPIFQLYDTYVMWDFKHKLLDEGIVKKKPYIFNLHLGKHHSHTIHKDPWSYLQLITNYNMVLATEPDLIVGRLSWRAQLAADPRHGIADGHSTRQGRDRGLLLGLSPQRRGHQEELRDGDLGAGHRRAPRPPGGYRSRRGPADPRIEAHLSPHDCTQDDGGLGRGSQREAGRG